MNLPNLAQSVDGFPIRAPITYVKPPQFAPRQPEFFEQLNACIPWEQRDAPRRESFMSKLDKSYTYGSGKGERTYKANPIPGLIYELLQEAEYLTGHKFELCFANGYADHQHHLGWHADNLGGMDHDRPIVVMSFGAEREIWFRENKTTQHAILRVEPTIDKLLLQHDSMLIMHAGMQLTHQHRIPKHPQPCGDRISLTFRGFKE